MQGRPTAAELVAAVATFLDEEVAGELSGRVGFHARVAANVLRIVERELVDGASIELASAAGLAGLPGSPDSVEELAVSIREGAIEVGSPELRAFLIRDVLARIAVDSPTYPSLKDVPESWRTAGSS